MDAIHRLRRSHTHPGLPVRDAFQTANEAAEMGYFYGCTKI